jgi:hypothetical protein
MGVKTVLFLTGFTAIASALAVRMVNGLESRLALALFLTGMVAWLVASRLDRLDKR